MDYNFPSGVAHVEIIPEAAKLDVNKVLPEELYRLLVALGVEPERAQEITLGIVDWRSPLAQGASAIDQYYLSLTPSFRARHASIEEIEELLLVKGVTPDIFYGTYVPVPDAELGGGPRLAPRGRPGGLPLGIRLGAAGGRQYRRSRRSGCHRVDPRRHHCTAGAPAQHASYAAANR